MEAKTKIHWISFESSQNLSSDFIYEESYEISRNDYMEKVFGILSRIMHLRMQRTFEGAI